MLSPSRLVTSGRLFLHIPVPENGPSYLAGEKVLYYTFEICTCETNSRKKRQLNEAEAPPNTTRPVERPGANLPLRTNCEVYSNTIFTPEVRI